MPDLRNHPAADLFPLLEGAEFDALAEDIRTHGLIEPIVMLDGAVLDGRNRIAACERVGVPIRSREWTGTGSPTSWVISVNLKRRHLNVTQRGTVAVDALPLYEAEAKKRQATSTGGPTPQLVERLPQADERRKARDEAGAVAGVSGRTVGKVAAIAKSAPDVHAAMRSGHIELEQAVVIAKLPESERAPLMAQVRAAPTIEARRQSAKHVTRGAKERHKAIVVESIASRPPPPATGPFGVIVIDPPWSYEKRKKDVTHRARLDYPDMTAAEIAALPVPTLAEPDAIVWLWTTNAHILTEASGILAAWGFTPKTILTWVKDRMGTGDWLRGKTEHCILAVRGRPVVNLSNQTTELRGPLREHSRKPDEFYALVNELCPGSKLEMFAREPRDGWAAWGAETGRFAS